MYFAVIEVIPKPNSAEAQKYGGSHVACWVNSTDWKIAREKAMTLIANTGWLIGKIVEEKEVEAESYSADDPSRDYFEQALTDDEVCVFYTFPKT